MSDVVAIKQDVPAPIPSQPVSLLQLAIDRGTSIDQLERLMQMDKQMRDENARRSFAAAMSSAKSEIGPIAKKRTVDFTSAKGRTHYKFEDMALIAEVVDPVLGKHGLSYRYRSKQENGGIHIGCVIAHRDGHEEETWLSAPRDESGNKNAIQSIASTATYLQRYTLKLALGLAAGPDTDGQQSAQQSEVATITPEQVGTIKELVESVDGNTVEFCRHFKIASVGDLPAARYDFAMSEIRARIKARGGK